MDTTRKILIAGQSGCGKTTLMKAKAAGERRVVHWDPEGEYRGELVTLADVPALMERKSFTAVYRPQYAKRPEELPREFDALAFLLLAVGRNLTVTVDEALTVLPGGTKTGGLGRLLYQGRKRGISVLYVTQYVTRLPTQLIGSTRTLCLFRLDGRGDLQVLRSYLADAQLQRVATLPEHEHVTVNK